MRGRSAPAVRAEAGARAPLGLRTHLFGVVLVAMLPTLAAAILAGGVAAILAEDAAQARMSDAAHALADAVDQELGASLRALDYVGADAAIDTADGLRRVKARLDMVAEMQAGRLSLLGRDGAVLVDSRTPLGPPGAAKLPLPDLAAVAAGGRGVLSDVGTGPRSLLPRAILLAPVHQGGTVAGVLALRLSSDRLTAALRRTSHPLAGLGVLVDRTGRVAAASHDVARMADRRFAPPAVDAAAPPGGGMMAWLVREWRHEGPVQAEAGLAHAPGWRVVYVADAASGVEPIARALPVSMAAALVAALLSLWLTGRLGSGLTGPLHALTEQARDVAAGTERPAEPAVPSRIAEFEALRQGMNRADAVLRRRGAAERMALREARTGHELLVSVVNGTAESIYVKDLELRYVLVNRAALRSGPVPRAEWQVLGRGTQDLFPPVVARRIETADRAVIATGRMTSFEQDYTPASAGAQPGEAAAGGATRWISMTIAPWQDAEGRVVGVVSVSRDITAQRAAETRMRAIQADLLRATRLSSMGAMASGLAHELNQPLAAATNYLNAGGRLLDRGELGDTAAFKAARGAVADAAQQMLRAGAIVRRLRDFVERGEAELQSQDVGELLREACDLARSDGITDGIALVVDIAGDAGRALVDRTQIQQVLLNLIRNAAEAIAQAGGATPLPHRGRISVTAAHGPQGSMMIAVGDNGPGLAHGVAERLFEPFVSTKPTGMGIGLAICRTIVEGHGGQLTAAANPDGGMLFQITLPATIHSGDGP